MDVMQFTFENIGPIDNGSVELGDLTIVCGPNNAGKTYVSYSIYGFLDNYESLIDFKLSNKMLEELLADGAVTIDLMEYWDKLPELISKASIKYSRGLSRYFSIGDDDTLLSNGKIVFEHGFDKNIVDKEFSAKINFGRHESIIIDKPANETGISIVVRDSQNRVSQRIFSDIISKAISECIFAPIFGSPFIVTSERTGIALFNKELDINRNAVIEHLTESDKIDRFSILNSMKSRYAQPIKDNVSTIRDYVEIAKTKSELRNDSDAYKSISSALKDLMGGTIKVVNKNLVYTPNKERNRDKVSIPIHMASSSIKSLLLVDMYVNYLATDNGVLIIDEPELNLHPDNQRKMAKLLVRLVNHGVKVIVTTHSDYLVREINNSIMLSSEFSSKKIL